MAVMRPLSPAVEHALSVSEWRLIAIEAGRYADGLRATVQAQNGVPAHIGQLRLANPGSWSDYETTVAGLAGCTAAEVHQAVLELHVGIEGQLRAQADADQAVRRSQATELVDMADVELWHTPGTDGEAWATIEVEGHREHGPVRVKRFRRWLAAKFHAERGGSPGSQALQDALTVLEGKALFHGPEHPVYTRLAGIDGRIYRDLVQF